MKRFFLPCSILILSLVMFTSCEKEEEQAPTFEEMLTGGSAEVNGRTWVLSKSTYPSWDGGGPVTNLMPALIPIPDDIQTILGDIYDTEFTFFSTGKYTIKPKDGRVLGATLYSTLNGIVIDGTQNLLGLCHANFNEVTNGTWQIHEEDFMVDAILNPLDAVTPPTRGNITFTGKKWLSFSTGAYFGILDGNALSHVIVKEITETEMHVALMVGMYQGVLNPGGLEYATYPTHIFQLTYVPKAK